MASYHQQAIALLGKGEWEQAHLIVQEHSDRLSSLLHAYVHRLEGDLWNASYWYQRGGETMPENTLEEELARLTQLVEKN